MRLASVAEEARVVLLHENEKEIYGDGFFSLETHLGQAHALGGFSGPELFTKAWQAFTDILKAEEIADA